MELGRRPDADSGRDIDIGLEEEMRAEVVVIGGGVIGCSCAYRLARRGMRVVLVERGDIASGASGACDGFLSVQSKRPGRVLRMALESLAMFERIEEELGEEVDGVYLALHGAMAVRNIPRPEAEMVRRVRKVVGDVPIMVTFDLHANEDVEMANAADAVFILKTYPHLDSHETGLKAGICMRETVRGEFKPVMAFRNWINISLRTNPSIFF